MERFEYSEEDWRIYFEVKVVANNVINGNFVPVMTDMMIKSLGKHFAETYVKLGDASSVGDLLKKLSIYDVSADKVKDVKLRILSCRNEKGVDVFGLCFLFNDCNPKMFNTPPSFRYNFKMNCEELITFLYEHSVEYLLEEDMRKSRNCYEVDLPMAKELINERGEKLYKLILKDMKELGIFFGSDDSRVMTVINGSVGEDITTATVRDEGSRQSGVRVLCKDKPPKPNSFVSKGEDRRTDISEDELHKPISDAPISVAANQITYQGGAVSMDEGGVLLKLNRRYCKDKPIRASSSSKIKDRCADKDVLGEEPDISEEKPGASR